MSGEQIELDDGPLRRVRCKGWSREDRVPDLIRVAFHRQAVGVWERLADGETRQADLWLTIEYRRMLQYAPAYQMTPDAALALTDADLAPFGRFRHERTPAAGRDEPVSASVNPTHHLSKSPVHPDESPNL